jgi:hypothetical protein
MARIITNAEAADYDRASGNRWAYNGLDCLTMHGVWQELAPRLERDFRAERTYRAQLGLQAPAMQVIQRGICFDHEAAKHTIGVLERAEARAERVLQGIADNLPAWREHPKRPQKGGLNPRSPQQVKAFFFEACGITPLKNKAGKVGTDEYILIKIRDGKYRDARGPGRKLKPKQATEYQEAARKAAKAILFARDKNKLQDKPKAHIGNDRAYCELKVGNTATFRTASSSNALGLGDNLQNVTGSMRRLFPADEGCRMFYIDLEQAESNVLAHLAGDEGYIEAHMNPEVDTHTKVCMDIWPDLEWPEGNAGSADKEYADGLPYYRHYTYRFMAKKVQHALGRGGTYITVAADLGIPQSVAKQVVSDFASGVPGVMEYFDWLQHEGSDRKMHGVLVDEGKLIVPGIGVKRQFFERLWDKSTFRDALAFVCQAPVAWVCHVGFWRIWHYLDGKSLQGGADPLQVLMHQHDAVMGQYHEGREDLLEEAERLMRVPMKITDFRGKQREMVIGTEAGTGKTWEEAG